MTKDYTPKKYTDLENIEACSTIVTNLMPEALGRLYVERHFPVIARYHINKMLEMIRLAYSSTLDQSSWMDKETLLYALVKLQSIESMVGYQDWIMDDGKLDKYYEKALYEGDKEFLEYIVSLHVIKSDEIFLKWNQTATRQNIGAVHPLFVNAFYHDKSNYVSLPAAFLGYPFYKYGRIDTCFY
ncbi:neprilysin-1-like [Uloborus diversus]|uniref:neprilysin-1-like n=1 Tax=Uloborus diversus TaxID=327109 RepID=UPI0024093AA0|nr:neprilysin-1-like [Uloborus diversus]